MRIYVKRLAEFEGLRGGVFGRVTDILGLVHCMALVAQTHCRTCDRLQDRGKMLQTFNLLHTNECTVIL